MYLTINFKSKAEAKRALASGQKFGVFQPGPFGGDEPRNGTVVIEGPHYPKPHRFYGKATVQNGIVVKIV